MPKAWHPMPVKGLQQPHVSPQCYNVASFNTSPKGYSNADKALVQIELKANAIIDEDTGRALEH
eukprot:10190700-Ditylum_brightwellii.AAC.1